jgi:hypothetical protein
MLHFVRQYSFFNDLNVQEQKMKLIFMVLSTVIATTSITAKAEDTLGMKDFKSNVVAKAANSSKGVIVVLTERGEVAADAAYLLASQLEQNPGFKPMLMAEEPVKLDSMMKTLSLPSGSLPAVIFYNKSGKELSRVVSALPALKMHDMQAAAF